MSFDWVAFVCTVLVLIHVYGFTKTVRERRYAVAFAFCIAMILALWALIERTWH